jgi:hypothetical protein
MVERCHVKVVHCDAEPLDEVVAGVEQLIGGQYTLEVNSFLLVKTDQVHGAEARARGE